MMFFTPEFISERLKETGFEMIEIIERGPYPGGVELESRRAHVFAVKPVERLN